MAVDNSGLPDGFVLDKSPQQTQSQNSSLPAGFVLDNQPSGPGYAPEQLTQPAPEFQGSPVSLLERAKVGLMADQDAQVKELSKQFKYVQPMPDGRIAVGNDLNNIKPVSSDELLNDSLGHIADHIKDAVMAASMTFGAGEAALAARGAGAVTRGLAQAAGAGIGAGVAQAGSEAVTPDNNLQDAAGRVALQTAFGAATDGLLQGAGFIGKKLVGAKTAALWGDTLNPQADGEIPNDPSKRPDLAEYIAQGTNPSKAVQIQQKLFQLTGNVDPRNIHSIATFGPENIYNDPVNNNPNTINDIAQGVVRAVKINADKLDSQLKDAASAFDNSQYNKANPDMRLNLNDQYQKYLQGLQKDRIGTIAKNDNGDVVGFNFSNYPSVKQDVNVHKQFMQELSKLTDGKLQNNNISSTLKTNQGQLTRSDIEGKIAGLQAIQPDITNQKIADVFGTDVNSLKKFRSGISQSSDISGNTFILPSQLRKMDIGEGLKMEQGFKVFKDDPHIARFFKTPEDPLQTGVNAGKKDTSLYGEINRIANISGNPQAKAYISARSSFKDYLQSLDNLHAVGGPELRLQGRNVLGVTEDAAKWLGRSTTIDTTQAKAMDALQAKLPYNFVAPSLKWSTANGVGKVNPNFFRFGMLMNFLTSPFGHVIHGANFVGGALTASSYGLKKLTSLTLGRGLKGSGSNIVHNKAVSTASDMAKRQLLMNVLNSSQQKISPTQ